MCTTQRHTLLASISELHFSALMPRPLFHVNPNNPYHLTGRCRNKDWFDLPMLTVWHIMEDHLFFLSRAFGISIHAFVLMNNHFHLMVTNPESNLSQAMQYFMGSTSRSIQKQSGRTNQIWGSRFHRTELNTTYAFLNCYKYLYRNPVRAEICEKVEEYPFSTLSRLLGARPLYFTMSYDVLLFDSPTTQVLGWLNQMPVSEDTDAVRKALKRTRFQLPKIRQKKNTLEQRLM